MPPYLSVPFPGHGSLEQVAAPEQGIFAVPALDGQDGFLELVLPSPDIHRTGLPDKKIRFSPQDRQAFRVPHMLRIQADFPDQQMRIRNPVKEAIRQQPDLWVYPDAKRPFRFNKLHDSCAVTTYT